MSKKKVAILGSTGSIGTQALDVIDRHRDRFEVVALAAGKQVQKVREQAHRFDVKIVATADNGREGLHRVAVESGADIVLAATDGFVSFHAVFAAVERGIDIAVANKELIVAAGELLTRAAARSGSKIVPVDSEHSAIFQCLTGEPRDRVAAIVLTASGGPFWRKEREQIENASVEDALAHPTWRMGVKNTIDSATMMNKGLEAIEASRLFGMPPERVLILVHPQSIAHGMVLFTDGSVKMQCAPPDMRLPIGYALAYPDRLPAHPSARTGPHDALTAAGADPEAAALRYEFERPDERRFPCITLAYEALRAGGAMPAVLSAANEIAVGAFVEKRLRFGQIPEMIKRVMERMTEASGAQAAAAPGVVEAMEAVLRADATARAVAQDELARLESRLEV